MKKHLKTGTNAVHHEKTPSGLFFPTSFNTEFSTLRKVNQRRIIALALVAMKRERDRLYEILPTGKKATQEMTPEEKNDHYQKFLPEEHDVIRLASFSCKFLSEFTGLKVDSLYSSFKKGCTSVTKKNIVVEIKDGKGKTIQSVTPIYEASFSTVHGCTIRVAESAVPYFMNHTRGFNEVDFKLWAELSSTHAMRLLQIVSGFKDGFRDPWRLETVRTHFGVGYVYWASDEEIEAADRDKYDMEMAKVGGIRELANGTYEKVYPKVADLRKWVIEPAFSNLIEKSDGIWTPTDKEEKGYKFIKTGRAYTHLEICLKYTDPEVILAKRKLRVFTEHEKQVASFVDWMVKAENVGMITQEMIMTYLQAKIRCGESGHIMPLEVEAFIYALYKSGFIEETLSKAKGNKEFTELANIELDDIVQLISEEAKEIEVVLS